jgi:hypothetical protein
MRLSKRQWERVSCFIKLRKNRTFCTIFINYCFQMETVIMESGIVSRRFRRKFWKQGRFITKYLFFQRNGEITFMKSIFCTFIIHIICIYNAYNIHTAYQPARIAALPGSEHKSSKAPALSHLQENNSTVNFFLVSTASHESRALSWLLFSR